MRSWRCSPAMGIGSSRQGTFTNAVIDSVGIVQEADRGTLFLDQLSDAPANVQDMLLTLLEVEEIKPMGLHGRKGRRVDVRVVAANAAGYAQRDGRASTACRRCHRVKR